jgi:hypothetical protein
MACIESQTYFSGDKHASNPLLFYSTYTSSGVGMFELGWLDAFRAEEHLQGFFTSFGEL